MTDQVEDLYLKQWEEVAGTCVEIADVETGTIIVLQVNKKKYRLRLPHIQFQPKTLQQEYIAVLKTESLEKPFLIRKMDTYGNNCEGHACILELKSGCITTNKTYLTVSNYLPNKPYKSNSTNKHPPHVIDTQ